MSSSMSPKWQTQRERGGSLVACSLGLLGKKIEVVSLATYMRLYKNGDILDIRRMDTVQNGILCKC